jgi:hypothetical protein
MEHVIAKKTPASRKKYRHMELFYDSNMTVSQLRQSGKVWVKLDQFSSIVPVEVLISLLLILKQMVIYRTAIRLRLKEFRLGSVIPFEPLRLTVGDYER